MFFEIGRKNGGTQRIEAKETFDGRIVLDKGVVPGDAETISFHDDAFTAQTGEKGFFLIPSVAFCQETRLTFFREREDAEEVFRDNDMPLFARAGEGKALLAVVEGMKLDYELVVGVKAGQYYLYPRFLMETGMYENIVLKYFRLTGEEATPAGMARTYRNVLLKGGEVRPLRERVREQSILAESLTGPQVRVRMGWKPMPPAVLEQDRNDPPPVHVAVTFDRFRDVLEEFKKQGIDHAEFCLVGWNKGGHDGQYPDLLPVEEALGGEEALKKLTKRAKEMGYLMGAHTNIYDSYSSAERWKKEDMIFTEKGEAAKGGQWCGGQSYLICPKQTQKKFVEEDMNVLKELGFNGTQYFDVNSILPPLPCHNPGHPLNRKEAAFWRNESFRTARKYFGATSSEGSLDFAVPALDFALYIRFLQPEKPHPMLDEMVPFREIVYHGILHYNYSPRTVNAPLKEDPRLPFLALAFGAQPMFYYYSKFLKDSPWGDRDLECGTDKALKDGVAMIRREYDSYKLLRDLQYLFIDEIRELEKDVFVTRYEDGTCTFFNGSNSDKVFRGVTARPLTLVRLDPDNRVKAVLPGEKKA
ncbi:MAG: hypothetical protein J6331_04950 [Lentisphaeria bacterium]|nr:hypothetical protein [Lentisphaeria bacterium]